MVKWSNLVNYLFHFIRIIMIQVAQANFKGLLLNQKISVMLGGISICPRKRDSSTYMIIHIFFVQMLQLPSQSVEQRTEKPITEATLIPMYHRVE